MRQLQENGDAAIQVSLGVSYAALTGATWGMAAEAGVFVGLGARMASLGASSWRTILGVGGTIGEEETWSSRSPRPPRAR